MAVDLSALCIHPDQSLREIIASIDRNERGIVLVTDAAQHLLGTITDGDIRRCVLDGLAMTVTARELLDRRRHSPYPSPITAPVGSDRLTLLHLMHEHKVRQVPLLDPDGCVCDLAVMDDLLPEAELPLHAMIMAGGRGMRLLPLTETVPKPMLPVGGRPIIEHIIGQLRETGIQQIHVSTHFMPEKIIDHFGDGTNFGVHLTYVEEDRPLGTAGALGLLDTPTEPLLVINGDILTRIDYRAFLEYHREHGAMMTMAVRKYDLNVPYGVVNTESVQVTGIVEKPVLTFFVNAGIYLLEPTAYQFITNGEHLDMTDLIQRLLDHQQKVVCFPVLEYWLDIGQPADYQSAQHEVADWRTHV